MEQKENTLNIRVTTSSLLKYALPGRSFSRYRRSCPPDILAMFRASHRSSAIISVPDISQNYKSSTVLR